MRTLMNDIIPTPIAARKPSTKTVHGITLTDDYAWLRDPKYPDVTDREVLDYLTAENSYFETAIAPHQPLIETIFQEMKGRIKEDDQSVPAKDGDYFYWRAFETGGQYRKWWRRPVAGGPDELILDEPALAAGKEFFRLGALTLSEDGRFMAYSVDDSGGERYTVHFKDLATGTPLPDAISGASGQWGDGTIEGTLGAITFSADGAYLFYGLVNENWRIDTI